MLDDKIFSDLPEFVEVTQLPDVGHSVSNEHFGANTMRYDWLVFLSGRRTPISLEFNLRSGQVTLDVCGKPKKGWQAKSLAEVFSVPFNFVHEGHKFTIRKQIDEDGEETEKLELDIDGLPFQKHQFISDDFILEDDKQLVYCAGLSLNKKEVFADSESDTWCSSMMSQRILKRFGDELIKAVKISGLN